MLTIVTCETCRVNNNNNHHHICKSIDSLMNALKIISKIIAIDYYLDHKHINNH